MQTIRSTFEQLTEIIDANDNSMSFHCVHGFLTALTTCPVDIPFNDLIETIQGNPLALSSQDAELANKVLSLMLNDIDRSFQDEDSFTLLYEEEIQDSEKQVLEDWCIGFMEAHFLRADMWFKENEPEVFQLLMPIMLASGLFNDEAEFKEILNNPQLTDDICAQIPDVLMELYLIFHAP